MNNAKFAAIALAAAIALSPAESLAGLVGNGGPPLVPGHTFSGTTPWWIFVCPSAIITAAVVKNARRHRQLTAQEAWTCGLLYFWNEGTGQYGG
jgi:hypothetical protein